MSITPAVLQTMNLGYLSGADLMQWCNSQILISEYNIRPYIFTKATAQAVSEVQSALQNIYDLSVELAFTDVIPPVALPVIAAGIITAANITSPGTGFFAAPTVTVTDTVGTGADITAQVSDSTITKINLVECGRHYTTAPAISFVGGNPTRPAAATATVDGFGHVTQVTITDGGSGYQSTPTIVFTGTGIGAAAVASVTYGKVTGLTVVSGGTNYTTNTKISFSMDAQIADQRNPQLTKIIGICAIRNILGSAQNISKLTQQFFADADDMIHDIRGGLNGLSLLRASKSIRSDVQVVPDKFRQLG